MSTKIAIVTGASSGLGREYVSQLLKKNSLDEIWVIARRKERLDELSKLTLSSGSTCTIRPNSLDLVCQESFEAISTLLEKEKPSVQYLVNAAGFGKIGSCILDFLRVLISGAIYQAALFSFRYPLCDKIILYQKSEKNTEREARSFPARQIPCAPE